MIQKRTEQSSETSNGFPRTSIKTFDENDEEIQGLLEEKHTHTKTNKQKKKTHTHTQGIP